MTTLVNFLLDRTGSMISIKEATMEAFNGYVNELKRGEDILFSLTQFDTDGIDKVYERVKPESVMPLSNDNYHPRSGTNLVDAAVKMIKSVEETMKNQIVKPKVVICIQTDGEENASTEYKAEDLKALVNRLTEQGWQFNFMGTGIDSYAQSSRLGFSKAMTMNYDGHDLLRSRAAFTANACNTVAYATGTLTSTAYSDKQKMAAGDDTVVK